MQPRHYPIALVTLVLTAGASVGLALLPAPQPNPDLDAAEGLSEHRYLTHVRFLASPEMQGRGNGSAELEDAADYLASQFRVWGLDPAGEDESYFQGFEATTDTILGEASSMTLGAESLEPMVDFAPLKFSSTGTASGELAFVGYGITAPEMHWDDYAGIDATGKIAVAFRHEPQENDPDSPFAGTNFTSHASLMNKAINAKQHGAAGILFIMDPNDHQPDEQELLSTAQGTTSDNSGLIAAYVRMEPVLDYFDARGLDLGEAQRTIDTELVSSSFEAPGSTVDIATDVRRVRSPLRNVVAMIEGSDPELKDEWVVVGAHYDHLGRSGEFSLDSNGEGQIHHGADDNASGTAGVLELARVAAANRGSFGRSLLFMGFAGEEIGLLGSNHFVNYPTIPLENTAAMINMDMIGRLRDNRVYASGVGTGAGLEEMVESLNDTGLTVDYSDSGVGGSDHMSFNSREVPVIFFFSGLHADYHKPSDTADKIDGEGALKVLRLAYRSMERLANEVERPQYTEVEEPRPISGSGGGGYGPYFGSVPDFREVDGVMFADINAGSPADDAGFAAGDILIEFNGKPVGNLYDFTYALQAQQPGDTVPVAVMRGDERIEADVTLEAR